MPAKSINRRVTELEERESIIYSFMDDLRKWAMNLDAHHKENQKRFKETDREIQEIHELTRASQIMHADALKQLTKTEKRSDLLEANLLETRELVKRSDLGLTETRKLLEVMHERVSRLEDRNNGHKK